MDPCRSSNVGPCRPRGRPRAWSPAATPRDGRFRGLGLPGAGLLGDGRQFVGRWRVTAEQPIEHAEGVGGLLLAPLVRLQEGGPARAEGVAPTPGLLVDHRRIRRSPTAAAARSTRWIRSSRSSASRFWKAAGGRG